MVKRFVENLQLDVTCSPPKRVWRCIMSSSFTHRPIFHCFSPPFSAQIARSSLRAVSLLRALRTRRVLHVSVPREEAPRRPPPLHHGEGRVRQLGADPRRPLLPARLDSGFWERQRRLLTFFFSFYFCLGQREPSSA